METRGTTKRDGCRRRARTTIEDFVKSYFFFHNLEIPQV